MVLTGLGRPAEGGLPARRALRHPARGNRVARDARGRMEEVLAGANAERILAAAKRDRPSGRPPSVFGDGHAAERMVAALESPWMSKNIHSTADVSKDALIGEGTRIWHEAQVREGARIGGDCVIGKGVYIDKGVVVGDRCKIQNRASLLSRADGRGRRVRRAACDLHQRPLPSRGKPGWQPQVRRRLARRAGAGAAWCLDWRRGLSCCPASPSAPGR